MRVGIIVDNEFDSDVRVTKQADILKRGGHEIFVLCYDFGKNTRTSNSYSISRIKMNVLLKNVLFILLNRIPIYNWIWSSKISTFIKSNNIDIIHVHDLYMAKPAHMGIRKSKKEIPLILDLHENFPTAITLYNWTKGWFRNLLIAPHKWKQKELKYLNYADSIIVLSNFFKNKLINNYQELAQKNFVVFPNVIDFSKFEEFTINPSISKRKGVTYFYFGGVAERRGIFETLDIFEKAIEQYSDINLLIIGPLDKADKESFFKKLNHSKFQENIEYIPWIKIEDLITYLNISDVCLSPIQVNDQHESGVANKVFQYMFGKKALIVSNCAPQKQLVESFECGLSYSNQNEYLDAIIKLYENPELREKMGMNGYKNLYKHYKNSTHEAILTELYTKYDSSIRS